MSTMRVSLVRITFFSQCMGTMSYIEMISLKLRVDWNYNTIKDCIYLKSTRNEKTVETQRSVISKETVFATAYSKVCIWRFINWLWYLLSHELLLQHDSPAGITTFEIRNTIPHLLCTKYVLPSSDINSENGHHVVRTRYTVITHSSRYCYIIGPPAAKKDLTTWAQIAASDPPTQPHNVIRM